MGRIARLKRITKARIEAFLDSIERPEDVLPQLEKEMLQKIAQAANAEAKALSAVIASQRKLDEATGRTIRLEKGAKLALEAKDTETSRRAIAALIETEKNIEILNQRLSTAKSAYNDAKGIRTQLQQNLQNLKVRRKDILARNREVKFRKKALKQYNGAVEGSSENILEIVAQMEAKVDQAQAEVEVHSHISHTLDVTADSKQTDHALRNAEVDNRLARLRRLLAGNCKNDNPDVTQ